MKTIKISLFFVGFAILTNANLQAKNLETVYGRRADIAALENVIGMKDLVQIVKSMEKAGVRIFRVLETEESQIKNQVEKLKKKKYFDFLPLIPINLDSKLRYKASEIQDEAALFISWNEIGSEKDGNIILIAEYALPTTLFHEFTHHLFEINNRADTIRISEDQNKYNNDLGTFTKRMGKVLFDRNLLVNPLWRRDIDNAIADTQTLADVVQSRTISEEIAVESGLLTLMWETRSPWFNSERAHQGIHAYGQGLVNMSKDSMENVLSLMDVVRTDGENMDLETKEDEILKRKTLYNVFQTRIEKYLGQDIPLMQNALNQAKAYLEVVKKNISDQF